MPPNAAAVSEGPKHSPVGTTVVHDGSIQLPKKAVPALITAPSPGTATTGIILGHGASGDHNSGNLPAIAQQLARAGLLVLQYTCSGQLPARTQILQGLLEADSPPILTSVQSWILAGHSMGGRTACAVAKQREDMVKAVVLFSYPLHPPGKPEQLRDEDLTSLRVPVMLVRGTKDPFSTEKPFQAVMSRMASSSVHVQAVDNGDHSLSTKSKAGQERFKVWMDAVIKFISDLPEKEMPSTRATDIQGEADPLTDQQVSDSGKRKAGGKRSGLQAETGKKTAKKKKA